MVPVHGKRSFGAALFADCLERTAEPREKQDGLPAQHSGVHGEAVCSEIIGSIMVFLCYNRKMEIGHSKVTGDLS
ncbi:MAG: hypothetical protein ACYC7L_14650 [Nitrospirota bacterium]